MKRQLIGYLALAAAAFLPLDPAAAQSEDHSDDFRAGHNFIETQVYSEADDKAILEACEGLRVADVSDGMDFAGLKNVGLI